MSCSHAHAGAYQQRRRCNGGLYCQPSHVDSIVTDTVVVLRNCNGVVAQYRVRRAGKRSYVEAPRS
jgi:hypothetical protein